MNTSTFLPGTVFVQVFIYLFDLCCMCEKECREWNWQSRHCYYPQSYRGNAELAPEESAVWLGSDAGAATELLHCIASLTLVVYLATVHHRWFILKQATQVRSYLWTTESQICLGRGKLKKAAAEVSSWTPLHWRKYNQESSALAADGVPSGLIFEWRKRDARSFVSCSTFGHFRWHLHSA